MIVDHLEGIFQEAQEYLADPVDLADQEAMAETEIEMNQTVAEGMADQEGMDQEEMDPEEADLVGQDLYRVLSVDFSILQVFDSVVVVGAIFTAKMMMTLRRTRTATGSTLRQPNWSETDRSCPQRPLLT